MAIVLSSLWLLLQVPGRQSNGKAVRPLVEKKAFNPGL
jgi:hypothetical protein